MSRKASTARGTRKGSVIVVGDGWAALACLALLSRSRDEGETLVWVTGSRARIVPVLPGLDATAGARAWQYLVGLFGIEAGQLVSGNFLREFRNKAFRHPLWIKAPTPEARRDVRESELWDSEANLCSDFEARFTALTLSEIEETLRAAVAALPAIERIDGDTLAALSLEEGVLHSVRLNSGRELPCSTLYYADGWSDLGSVSGMPKPVPFNRHREPVGLLQLQLKHHAPLGQAPVQEGFFGPIQREAGEEFQRQVWGHFSSDGRRSHWSVALGAKEIEDNHEIAKKIRRMKQALDKMFVGPEWLPEGVTEFCAPLEDEQVRFEENVLFDRGREVRKAQTLPAIDGAFFLTDGYGPAAAFEQAFGELAPQIDLSGPLTAEWESAAERQEDLASAQF